LTTAVRTELLKIRTTRMFLALLGLAAALTLLVTVIEASREGGRSGTIAIPSLSTAAGLRAILTNTGFGMLVATVFGTIVASGEFRHKTATDTYLDEPRRTRVLTAKVVAGAAAGAAFGLVAAALATGVGLLFVAAKGYHVALATGSIGRFAAGAVVASGLMAAVGVGLGSLLRSQVGAIIAVFAWGLGVEQIAAGLSGSIAPYLPVTAASTLAGATSEAAMPPVPSGLDALPFGAAAALLAALAILMAALAAAITLKRDVT
jgi:ABC-type transport system involved in multi-copper enzyme maturation permease subunit